MKAALLRLSDRLYADGAAKYGALPAALIAATLVTGTVDAVSYLALGHIFVANMTGNVVFLGFALAGAPGFSVGASLVALAAFAAGALLGGVLTARHAAHRARLFSVVVAVQALFLAAGTVLAGISGSPVGGGYRYALIVALGVAMGLQNAAARKLAVPDLTTTVLTLTITGVAADSGLAGGGGSKAGRRLTAVVTMLAGALVGAVLVRHAPIWLPLGLAVAVTVAAAVTAYRSGKTDPPWVRTQP
ncbi:MAG TPA: YoaK family protein [Streptosporangiaceae bacterium]